MNITEVKTRSYTYYVLESSPDMIITTQYAIDNPEAYYGSEDITSHTKEGYIEITKERHEELLKERERIEQEKARIYQEEQEALHRDEILN